MLWKKVVGVKRVRVNRVEKVELWSFVGCGLINERRF